MLLPRARQLLVQLVLPALAALTVGACTYERERAAPSQPAVVVPQGSTQQPAVIVPAR